MKNLEANPYLFEKENPIPLVTREDILSQKAKVHSEFCDRFLGFNIANIEEIIRHKRHSSDLEKFETWAHLPAQVFLTPYTELRYICSLLPLSPTDIVADLGCAYARMPHVLQRFYPEVRFLGLECVQERVDESIRVAKIWGIENCIIYLTDLSLESFDLPMAQHYFIYDTGTQSDVEKILLKMRERVFAKQNSFKVKSLVLRGARSLEVARREHPWLPQPIESHQNFKIFHF